MSRSVVAAMTAYTLELRQAEIKLNQNESPFDFPRDWKQQALARVAGRAWNRYPDFESTALRTAIAKAYGLTADNILAGNGSNELLAAAIGAFVGPGTPVIFPRPTFALYEKLVTIAGGLPIPIDFEPDSGLLPQAAILAAIAKYENAVVIVCSPNNPTGGVLPDLDALLATNAMVLLDEAYVDFTGGGQAILPVRPNLVTFRTFSKAWGLAALRVGWLASTADNCREIRKVKLPYSLNIISEAIAEVALENRDIRDRNVAYLISERERVFRSMQPIVDAFPSRANFICFRSAKKLFDPLLERGILIRQVANGWLRVSIGTREQNDAFLAALKELA
ncbi:MAG TPA: aminotransferase class I/II-fold pyridoxal phosphate-dependent enzyme [Thermoanaerobaculia bacterium]|nr:aminotransferase class I/II-fold pyridoxal phosphate-dependent enzyme [Thermoanaerobaculia bacterium]